MNNVNLMSIAYLINNSTDTYYHTEITLLKEEVPYIFSYNENNDNSVEQETAPTFSLNSVWENEGMLSYQVRTNSTQFVMNSHQIQNNAANDTQMNSKVEINSDEETISDDEVIYFYQKKETSKGILKGRWREEEEKKLIALIAQFGGNRGTFEMETWSKIANKMKSRTIAQIKYHWSQHLNSNRKKYPWTKEEDKILKEQVQIHPNQWQIIAESLPGRTNKQIEIRWKEKLVNKRISCWTVQEDKILITHLTQNI